MIIDETGLRRGKQPVTPTQRALTNANRKRRLAGEADLEHDDDYEAVEIESSKRRILQVSNHSSRRGGMSYHTDLSHFTGLIELSDRIDKARLEIVGYQNTSTPIISKAPFARLVGGLIRDWRPDFKVQASAIDALQLATETYITTFLAGMISSYLSHELITQYYISAVNNGARHAGRVTIMPKDFRHVNRIGYLLGAFKDDPDINMSAKTNAVIMDYSQGKEVAGLTMAQKNKIDAILTIQEFEYVIYHTELSLKFIN